MGLTSISQEIRAPLEAFKSIFKNVVIACLSVANLKEWPWAGIAILAGIFIVLGWLGYATYWPEYEQKRELEERTRRAQEETQKDRAAFEAASKENSGESFRRYLQSFPTGVCATQALAKLAEKSPGRLSDWLQASPVPEPCPATVVGKFSPDVTTVFYIAEYQMFGSRKSFHNAHVYGWVVVEETDALRSAAREFEKSVEAFKADSTPERTEKAASALAALQKEAAQARRILIKFSRTQDPDLFGQAEQLARKDEFAALLKRIDFALLRKEPSNTDVIRSTTAALDRIVKEWGASRSFAGQLVNSHEEFRGVENMSSIKITEKAFLKLD